MQITEAQVRKIIGKNGKDWIIRGFVDGVNEFLSHRSALETAHFTAQTAHECDRFNTTEEYASGKAYEGRRDLGNTQRGDGVKFKGKGLIQTTGRYNTEAFFDWLAEHYPALAKAANGDPEKLKEFPYAFLSAIFYWDTHNCARFAMRNDIKGLTKSINGGYNGLTERTTLFVRTSLVLLGYNMTKGATARFQKDRGLKVDDVAGPVTINELALALLDLDIVTEASKKPKPAPVPVPDTTGKTSDSTSEKTSVPPTDAIWSGSFNLGPWEIGLTLKWRK